MRRLLYVVGAVIVVLVLAVVAALEALKSGVGKDQLAAALSSAIGMPVEVNGLSVSLFPPGLQATGVRIGGADREAAPGVAVARLDVIPQLTSLFPGGTPHITRADLVGLVISVRRTAAGRWQIPVPPPGATGSRSGPAGSSVEVDALRIRDGAIRVVDDSLRTAGGPTITIISAINAGLRIDNGTLMVNEFSGRLGQTAVSGSAEAGPRGIVLHITSASLKSADLSALFALAGMAPYPGLSIAGRAPVELTTRIGPDFTSLTVLGKTSIDQVSLNGIALQQLQTPFHLEHKILTLDPMTFMVYGGREQGVVSVDLARPTPVFSIRTVIQGLDVNQALSATTTMKDFMLGTARVEANVQGSGTTKAAVEQTLSGTARFALQDGDIRNFPVLSVINQALGITQGSTTDTKFQSLTGSANIGAGQARSTDLTLKAGELSMFGQGTFGFDKSLNLQLRAVLAPAKAAQLAQLVPVAKRLENSRGEIELPVAVTGLATAPKISVDIQSIAKQQLPGVVQDQVRKRLPKELQNLLPK